MRRVMVIGCSGSGKSTFAMRLAARTGLPFVSLDALHWQPGWREPDRGPWREIVRAAAAEDRWIMDGGYLGTAGPRLARADTVVWFDLPRWICLAGVLGRIVTGYGRVRQEMAAGCPERFDLDFLRYVWTFDRRHRPLVVELVAALSPAQRLVQFRSRRDVDEFLTGLPGRPAPASVAPA